MFIHYSPKQIERVEQREQDISFKPRGIYFSRDDAWLKWCDMVDFYPNIYRHKYGIENMDALNILYLNTPSDVDAFDKKYGIRSCKYVLDAFSSFDWTKVSQNYDGMFVPLDLIKQVNAFAECNRFFMWHGYDVETLVIWSPKLKLKLKYISQMSNILFMD